MARTHCIEHFDVDIAFSSEALARREQGRLQQWLGEDLLPAVDELFSRVAPGKKLLRFDRLEFDFGTLSARDYQQEISRQLVARLRSLLESRMLELPHKSAQQLPSPTGATPVSKALEQLVLFLRTGQLPWYRDTEHSDAEHRGSDSAAIVTATKQHHQLLAALMDTVDLAAALRAIPEREQLLERLVNQFPEQQLIALLQQYAPGLVVELGVIWQLLELVGAQKNIQVGSASLKKSYWKNLLRLWLVQPSLWTSVGAGNWPADFLRGIARDHGLSERQLQWGLQEACDQLPAQLIHQTASALVDYVRANRSLDTSASAPQITPVNAQASSGQAINNQAVNSQAVNSQASNNQVLNDQGLPWARNFAPVRLDGEISAGATDLRFKLAQIFNGAQGNILEAIWPQLLARHRTLLVAALDHYWPLPDIRQQCLLKFPIDLLGEIFELLRPGWSLTSLYQSLAKAPVASAVGSDIARELWEISFNLNAQHPAAQRLDHLAMVLRDFAHRHGIAIGFLFDDFVEACSSQLSELDVAGLQTALLVLATHDADIEKTIALGGDNNIPSASDGLAQSTASATVGLNSANTPQKIIDLASPAEWHLLQRFFQRVVDDGVTAKPASSDETFAGLWQQVQGLPNNLLTEVLHWLAQQKLSANLADKERQSLFAQLKTKVATSARSVASELLTLDARHAPTGLSSQTALQNSSQADSQALSQIHSQAAVPTWPEPATKARVHISREARWREFLLQLKSGQIALADLQLNDNSGVQVIEQYLAQADHIAADFRQDLLTSVISMSRRARDTAEYYRRILHCLIHQQPLDFDDLLTNKKFWRNRVKAVAPDKARIAKPSVRSAQALLEATPLGNIVHQLQAGQMQLEQLQLADDLWPELARLCLAESHYLPSKARTAIAENMVSAASKVDKPADFFRAMIQLLLHRLDINFHLLMESFSKPAQITASDESLQPVNKFSTNPATGGLEKFSMPEAQTTAGVTQDQSPAGSALTIMQDSPDYEQQLWELLAKIRNSDRPTLRFSLQQLKQLVGFYLTRSPTLSDAFRTSLSSAIALQAERLEAIDQRVNFYANALKKMLAGDELDVEAEALLMPASWLLPTVNDIHTPNTLDSPSVLGDSPNVTVDGNGQALATAINESAYLDESSALASLAKFSYQGFVQLVAQLRTGRVQLQDLPLSELQLMLLAETAIAHHASLDAEQKHSWHSFLSDHFPKANHKPEFLRALLQQLLMSSSIDMSMVTQGINENLLQDFNDNNVDEQVQENISVAVRSATDKNSPEIVSAEQQLWVMLEKISHAHAPVFEFNLTQLKQLVAFYLARSENISSQYRTSLADTLSRRSQNLDIDLSRHFYANLLQKLLSDENIDVEAPQLLLPATWLKPSIDNDRIDNVESKSQQGVSGTKSNSLNEPLFDTDDIFAPGKLDDLLVAGHRSLALNASVSLVDALQINRSSVELSSVELAPLLLIPPVNEENLQRLVQLGQLLARDTISANQLAMSQQERADWVKLLIAKSPQISSVNRTQLLAASEKIAARAASQPEFLRVVLQVLFNETEINQALLAMTTVESASLPQIELGKLAERITQLNLQKMASLDMTAIKQDQVINQDQSINQDHSIKQEPISTQQAMNKRDPAIKKEPSISELLQQTSLASEQSIYLQQLIKNQLNRGKAIDILSWLNTACSDEQLLRLAAQLPDYAMHQLLRLAYPDALAAVYPEVKHVLDALATAAIDIRRASVQQAKWLFVLQRILRQGNSKPDARALLILADQLLQAAEVSDRQAVAKLVQQRLDFVRHSEEKSAADKTQDSSAADELLSEALEEGIHISNAGQVLAAPYLGRLFAMLQLTNEGQFVSLAAKDRAAHLLEYMVTGQTGAPEYDLLLNKVLCGISTSIPISAGIEVTEQEKTIIEQMLTSMIQHWKAIGSTSITGLRETFLQRQGWLYLDEEGWHLRVQPATFDMLLDRLPWSISLIKHGWMDLPLKVSWRE